MNRFDLQRLQTRMRYGQLRRQTERCEFFNQARDNRQAVQCECGNVLLTDASAEEVVTVAHDIDCSTR